MPRLTKRMIDATPCPPAGEVWLPDDTLPGFGVRLRAGRKTYSVRYRTPAGQLRRETLGLTTLLSLDAARQAAQALLVAVRQGQDPAAARQAARQAPTLAQLAARYLEEHSVPHKKPRSVQGDRSNLAKHILPALGTQPVHTLTTAHLATLHH